jgi:hypothetical protein
MTTTTRRTWATDEALRWGSSPSPKTTTSNTLREGRAIGVKNPAYTF